MKLIFAIAMLIVAHGSIADSVCNVSLCSATGTYSVKDRAFIGDELSYTCVNAYVRGSKAKIGQINRRIYFEKDDNGGRLLKLKEVEVYQIKQCYEVKKVDKRYVQF